MQSGGLYLFKEEVKVEANISEICIGGLIRKEDEKYVRRDPAKSIHLFVYVMLYSMEDNNYVLKYRPALIYHGYDIACLTRGQFNWTVEKGDRIGAFIPESCTNISMLPEDILINQNETFSMLCPSQINLVNGANQCYSSLFVNETFDQVNNISLDDHSIVPVRLSMTVTYERGNLGKKDCKYFIVGTRLICVYYIHFTFTLKLIRFKFQAYRESTIIDRYDSARLP